MSIVSEINRINTNIANAYSKCNEKGATMPQVQNSSNLANTINSISSGSGDLDWNNIGFSGTPQSIIDDYNYAKNIYDNWDSTQTTMYNKYNGNTDLVYMPGVDCSNATTTRNMFQSCSKLFQVGKLKISDKTTTMRNMFASCSTLRYIDCSDYDTSKVTDFRTVFNGCNAIKELDLSTFVSTSATDISQMFYTMNSIEKIDVRNFVFSTVATKSNVFGSTIPTNCLIIVKDATEKTWININYPSLTNVKTVAEYNAMQ